MFTAPELSITQFCNAHVRLVMCNSTAHMSANYFLFIILAVQLSRYNKYNLIGLQGTNLIAVVNN